MRLVVLSLALAVLAGCSGSPSSSSHNSMPGMNMDTSAPPATGAAVTMVTIQGFAFHPGDDASASSADGIHVQAGVTIQFVNKDSVKHTVHIHDPQTDTMISQQDVPGGETVTVTFPHAGTYHLFCNIHTSMTAVVSAT